MPTPESMSVPEKLADIKTTKTAIREAIVAKGVDVPDGTTFREYATKISDIQGGAGGAVQVTCSNAGPIAVKGVSPDGEPVSISNGETANFLAKSMVVVEALVGGSGISVISGDATYLEFSFSTSDYYKYAYTVLSDCEFANQ